MVTKTKDDIHVPISIGKYIITFHFFSYIGPKKVLLLKILKVRWPLEKLLPLCKGGGTCKNKFYSQCLWHPVVS